MNTATSCLLWPDHLAKLWPHSDMRQSVPLLNSIKMNLRVPSIPTITMLPNPSVALRSTLPTWPCSPPTGLCCPSWSGITFGFRFLSWLVVIRPFHLNACGDTIQFPLILRPTNPGYVQLTKQDDNYNPNTIFRCTTGAFPEPSMGVIAKRLSSRYIKPATSYIPNPYREPRIERRQQRELAT